MGVREMLYDRVLNYMVQILSPMVLKEGHITRAGDAPEKVSRKASRCRAHPHGQELRSGQWGGGEGQHCWESLGEGVG